MHLKNSGETEISVSRLDQIMQNVDNQQFTYDTFKTAYDNDPKIQDIVKNFDQNTLTLKTSAADDITAKKPKNRNKIRQMAKRAVDL